MLSTLEKINTATLIIIVCVLCSIISSLSDMCPDDMKDKCMNGASILNCVLCGIVFAHYNGFFKKA